MDRTAPHLAEMKNVLPAFKHSTRVTALRFQQLPLCSHQYFEILHTYSLSSGKRNSLHVTERSVAQSNPLMFDFRIQAETLTSINPLNITSAM
jgi:hypothetical protein